MRRYLVPALLAAALSGAPAEGRRGALWVEVTKPAAEAPAEAPAVAEAPAATATEAPPVASEPPQVAPAEPQPAVTRAQAGPVEPAASAPVAGPPPPAEVQPAAAGAPAGPAEPAATAPVVAPPPAEPQSAAIPQPAAPAGSAAIAPAKAPLPRVKARAAAHSAPSAGHPDDYEAGLARLRGGDLSGDLKALRQQHAARAGSGRWEDAKVHFAQLDTDPAGALAAAQARLEQDWLTPEAHLLAEIALGRLDRKGEAAGHHAFLLAWLRSVTGDRDGLTAATAWNAAAVDEEYFALMLMGRKVDGQSLVNGKDGVFDLMHTTDRRSGTQGDIWFDISSFFGHELDGPEGR